jgi:hypothetical protein
MTCPFRHDGSTGATGEATMSNEHAQRYPREPHAPVDANPARRVPPSPTRARNSGPNGAEKALSRVLAVIAPGVKAHHNRVHQRGRNHQSPIATVTAGGSVQRGLSAAGGALGFYQLGLAADKRYSLGSYEGYSMRNCLCVVVVALSVMLAAKPASACLMMAGLELDDIKYASVVVIGRIVDYQVVLDQAVRKQRKEELERSADKSSESWRLLSEQKQFLSDYAHFSVLVDEVLVGQPPNVISVTWDNSTFGEPEKMKEGPYLIGLREPGSKSPPLRGPSATILPSPEPKSLTVLQAPCAPAFILEATGAEAKSIREMLGGAAK